MKRYAVICIVLVLALPILAASEAEGAGANEDVFFHWDSWQEGTSMALLGAVGALLTMFALIGGAVPGTAAKARIDEEMAVLKQLEDRLLELVNQPGFDADSLQALNDTVDKKRDDLTKERWLQFFVGSVLYVLLGAFFANALAHDYVQALVIGAGWTSYVGALGLKTDFAKRKQIKDESIEEAGELLQRKRLDGHAPVKPASPEGLDDQEMGFDEHDMDEVLRRFEVARAV